MMLSFYYIFVIPIFIGIFFYLLTVRYTPRNIIIAWFVIFCPIPSVITHPRKQIGQRIKQWGNDIFAYPNVILTKFPAYNDCSVLHSIFYRSRADYLCLESLLKLIVFVLISVSQTPMNIQLLIPCLLYVLLIHNTFSVSIRNTTSMAYVILHKKLVQAYDRSV